MEQPELAEMLGFKSASAISEWEKGKRIPNVGVLSDIANIFNISLSDLMEKDLQNRETIIESNSNPVPLVGTIAAGTPILAKQNIERYFHLDKSIKADFALKIKGDSMIGTGIYEDDIVFIKKQPDLENGEIGAVQINDIECEATLKRVYKDNNSITLVSENPKYPPRVFKDGNIKILGKLVATLNIKG
jgi:repressor LexA